MEMFLFGVAIASIGAWIASGSIAGLLIPLGIFVAITGIVCIVEKINLGEYIGSRIGGFQREYKKALEMRDI